MVGTKLQIYRLAIKTVGVESGRQIVLAVQNRLQRDDSRDHLAATVPPVAVPPPVAVNSPWQAPCARRAVELVAGKHVKSQPSACIVHRQVRATAWAPSTSTTRTGNVPLSPGGPIDGAGSVEHCAMPTSRVRAVRAMHEA